MSPPPPAGGSEADAHIEIDAALETAGWVVQDREEINLSVAHGVAVREFKLKHGYGYADYLLFVDGKAVGCWRPRLPVTP
jgi:type I restriction enzyme R subunit